MAEKDPAASHTERSYQPKKLLAFNDLMIAVMIWLMCLMWKNRPKNQDVE